jgi:pimeloyl-ACP methyl ester carboxylesterase
MGVGVLLDLQILLHLAAGVEFMSEVSIVGPDEGEVALSGRVRVRILEDGSSTAHRLGLAELTVAPRTAGPRSTGTPSTTRFLCRVGPGPVHGRRDVRIASIVLVDAVGIEVPGHPVADFFALTLDQVADLSYHDPDRFRINPAMMSPEQQAAMAGNRQALAAYAGTAMTDESLRGRLGQVSLPVCVLWGDSDRIVDPDYGRVFAAGIPGAEFRLLSDTGHVPQVESPDRLLGAIREFASARSID